ncbi:MAG TPA: acetyl-CoA hydrolase/transferase C-terminal domain-containing protein [Verrucomicrobiae bacterium]|nr:acetyl-CoA hydrolase/transferase C-terminal domain-containing protein [Verrucomicrobiae bacterium]
MTRVFRDVDAACDALLAYVGCRVVLGIPLGLGKPIALTNALYRRAAADPKLQLTILTALTLEKPRGASAIEQAFLAPFVERVYGDCPDLDYAVALREQKLPTNVKVSEFFFRPGTMLANPSAQQQYVSSNYTHAARDAAAAGCNVVAQMVAKREIDGEVRYSLSCNPDTGPELVERLRASGREFMTVAQVNPQLPYIEGSAEVPGDWFDLVIDGAKGCDHVLFSTPKLPVATADFAIGLHASTLVRDAGTLQVGIGSLGDAVVHALLLRHQRNAAYQAILGELQASITLGESVGGLDPFGVGLYGASEMLVDGFMDLHRAGILKRHVYGFWALQQLVNDGRCNPDRLAPQLFTDFESLGVRVIRTQDFEMLQRHGVFTDDTRYDAGYIVAPDGERVIANVADPATRRVLGGSCLGPALRNGRICDAAFYLGTNAFYQWLRELPDDERRAFNMTGVARINQLDLNPRLYQLQRVHARFMNTGLMVTLGGAVVSDGLDDGRVVSGVGGQYNFIAMAHQLATGRAVLMLRAARESGGTVTSNIVYNYAHTTIPRHLRDLVVTEYGVADLRSRSDRDVAVALIGIADTRFQDELLSRAKATGKVEAGYVIPAEQRDNTPEQLARRMAPHQALFPEFPLGSDFTADEQRLMKALQGLKSRAARGKLSALWQAVRAPEPRAEDAALIGRVGLDRPKDLQQRVARKLLGLELADARGA